MCIILDTLKDAILIPADAVQESQKGKYVYVVKGNQTVEMRGVKVGQRQEKGQITITEGIKKGEKIVVDGFLNLYPGAHIQAQIDDEDL